MKKVASILKNVFLIISIAILIFCIFIAIKSKQLGRDIYILGYKPYIIATGSMETTLKVRGLVVIKQVPYEEIEIEDIISFVPNGVGKSICHRVVGITNEGFITKGDNNFSTDRWIISKEEYQGKLVYKSNIYANAYYAITEGNKSVVLGMALLIVIALIIAIWTGRHLKRTLSKKDL